MVVNFELGMFYKEIIIKFENVFLAIHIGRFDAAANHSENVCINKIILTPLKRAQWRIYSVEWVDLSTGLKGPGALKIRNK
jgi:hypothetical protein